MTEQMSPAAKKLKTVKEAERIFSREDITILAFFATEDSPFFDAFTDAGRSACLGQMRIATFFLQLK
jgi:hypothetical protein